MTYSQHRRMANDCTVPEYSGATVAIVGLTFSCIVSNRGFIGYDGDCPLFVVSRKRLIEVCVHVFKSITRPPIPSSFQLLTSSSPPPTLINQISLSFPGRTCSGPSLCVLHLTTVHHLATADPPLLPRILVLASCRSFYTRELQHTLFSAHLSNWTCRIHSSSHSCNIFDTSYCLSFTITLIPHHTANRYETNYFHSFSTFSNCVARI